MDPARFTEAKPGQLRRFKNPETGRDDWLFIPDELPPNWQFPVRLWPLLADAREALGTLNGIGQTLPNPELLLRPLQSREAITSSSIEGTYVTPQQLLLYELDPSEPHTADEEAADWREVFNYGEALRHGCRMLQELPIASRLIRGMHGTLMQGVRGRRKIPGEFRPYQVQIGATGRYIPPPRDEIPRLMSNLEQFINSEDHGLDPLVMCYLTHYQFEAIHPFADGNGRVGRVLLALMIYQQMGHSMPWLYMSAFFERHKDEYMHKLFRISTHGDWDDWIEFCLTGTVAQARDAIARCNQFNEARKEYRDLVASPTPRTADIIEQLFSRPAVTITSLAKRYSVTYRTAKTDIEKLVESGILTEVPGSRPKSFYAEKLIQIAFRDFPSEHPREQTV